MMHPTTQYAHDVVYGPLGSTVCLWEKLACERHLKDLERQGTDDFPYVFDETRADRIFTWFEICRHVRGPFQGQPIELLDWQKFDLGCSYGWVHKDTGARRFRVSFEERGRGNVKSTEKSAECLYFMCADAIYPPGRPELAEYEIMPEIECAAVDRDQAKRVWGDGRAMALASPDIADVLEIQKHNITHKYRGGYIRPLSRETKNKDSGAPCGVIIDEYHAHPTSEIKDTLKNSFGKRHQSFMRIITTAGKDAENNPGKKERDIGVKILQGEIAEETYFVMIRELDEGDDPHDEANWCKANPVLRSDSVYARNMYVEIKSEHDLAFGSGDPDKILAWMIKRMDLWQSSSEEKYMTAELMEKWKSLAVSREVFKILIQGTYTINGNDASKREDLTAAGFVHELRDGRIAVSAYGFIPEGAATRHEKTDRVPYRFWAKKNWCDITPGEVNDMRYLEKYITAYHQENELVMKESCNDSYNLSQFMIVMEELGYTPIEVRQGKPSLSEATKLFRNMIREGKVVHDGNELLTWCLSNAYEEQDTNENIKLSKKHAKDTQRIDLVAAIINAMTQYVVKKETRSVYEERGILIL